MESNTESQMTTHQKKWQRNLLLIILIYEGISAMIGGNLIMAAPNGRYINMSEDLLHGTFRSFLAPGIILVGLGILNIIAFIAMFVRTPRSSWVWAALAMGGLLIWFIVETIIVKQLNWLHLAWGLPALIGCLLVIPLIPRASRRHFSPLG